MDLQRRLLTQICHLYYKQNMTQQEISRETGLSRIKISRLLQKAKDMGIVNIAIDYNGSFLDLENTMIEKYKLKSAIIVDSTIESDVQNTVSAAAAFYLENNLLDNSTVAVGWGTTLRKIQEHLPAINKSILFSPIIGGHGKSEFDIHASSIASNLAKRIGNRSLSLLVPAFVHSKEEKEVLLRDSLIKEVLSVSASADYALFSLGNPLVPGNSITKSGYFSDSDIELLHRENALCDIVSVLFLNEKCQPCCESITNRSIGLSPEELKGIPTKICVVHGEQKYSTVKIALEAGYIDVLIMDNKMADYLMK